MQSQTLGKFRILLSPHTLCFFPISDLFPSIPDLNLIHILDEPTPSFIGKKSRRFATGLYQQGLYSRNKYDKKNTLIRFKSLTVYPYLYRFAFKVAVLANIAQP